MVTPKDQIPILSLIYKPKKPSLPLSILGEMDEMGSNGGKSEKMGGHRVRERVLEWEKEWGEGEGERPNCKMGKKKWGGRRRLFIFNIGGL